MRISTFVAKWLFALCLPIFLFTASIAWEVNSLWLYKNGFNKYNVGQTTGLAETELEKAATSLISYFNSDEEYISITVSKDNKSFELFNDKEIKHLKDVKRLIWFNYWVLLGTLLYALAYAGAAFLWAKGKYRQRLARGMIRGCTITLFLMLILGLGTLLNFDQLFLQFHFLSFTNDLWMLDPTTDYLIMLFPQGFFYDAAILCAITSAGLAIIIGGASGSYLWVTSKQAKR